MPVFPMLEGLLGGTSGSSTQAQRELTDVERDILEGINRIILRDLKKSWKSVAEIDFSLQAPEPDLQPRHILPSEQAVVVVTVEAKLAETASGR